MGTLALLPMLALATPLAGCPDDGAVCTDDTRPTSFDAQNPKIGFAKDVMPIFAKSCAFPSCHGSTNGSTNGVFLGGSDPRIVHAALVDVRSSTLPTMGLVTAYAPRESFLQRKLDGSHCVLDAQCIDTDCGQTMPRNGDALSVDERDVVWRWIAQGAKND